VIENVEGAKKYLIDPVMLCGTSFGLETPPYYTAPEGFELQRHRLFEVFGFPVSAPPCRHSGRPVISLFGGHCRDRRRDQRTYSKKTRKLQSYRHKPLSRCSACLPDHPCPTSVLA
jgi:hypothetical protein